VRARRAGIASASVAVALAGLLSVRAHAPDEWTAEERVLLAMFEQQVPRVRAAFPGEEVWVCLLVDTGGAPQDPSRRILDALPRGRLRRGAQCEARGEGAVELATGAPAALLTVGPVEWIADDEAWVKVSRFRDRRRLATATHRVVREHGRWVALGPILKQSPV
jgi:hypothetical protein